MKTLRKYWSSLVAFATALMSLFSGFLVGVPSDGEANHWYKFGKFLVAVCIGLWLVPVNTWNRKTHKWHWWTTALGFLIFSIAAVLKYADLVDKWSLPYYKDERVVIGKTLSSTGEEDRKKIVARGGVPYNLTLLQRTLGDPKRVWVPEEVDQRQHLLTILYLVALLVLASTVVTVAHAAYCSTKSR
jgi:hypothetical protein